MSKDEEKKVTSKYRGEFWKRWFFRTMWIGGVVPTLLILAGYLLDLPLRVRNWLLQAGAILVTGFAVVALVFLIGWLIARKSEM